MARTLTVFVVLAIALVGFTGSADAQRGAPRVHKLTISGKVKPMKNRKPRTLSYSKRIVRRADRHVFDRWSGAYEGRQVKKAVAWSLKNVAKTSTADLGAPGTKGALYVVLNPQTVKTAKGEKLAVGSNGKLVAASQGKNGTWQTHRISNKEASQIDSLKLRQALIHASRQTPFRGRQTWKSSHTFFRN